MKKLYSVICIMLILCLLPVSAFAQNEQKNNENSVNSSDALYFSIDNENVYQNMDKAYKDGYMPQIIDNKAVIILPLTASGKVLKNTIKVTPNLGDTSSSPFVFKNYQKTIALQDNSVNNGNQTVSSYYILFELELSSSRINGTYPVAVEIQAVDQGGMQISQTFTTYVTITDGVNPNAQTDTPSDVVPAESDTQQKPTSQPIVIVSNHITTPSPVSAGEDFEIDVTLLNTSENKSVKNMLVTVTCENTSLTLLNDSNTFYIKKLKSNSTDVIKLKYKAGLDITPGKYNINLSLSYDNAEATTLTSTGLIAVEINQPLKIEMTVPQIAKSVNAGDTLPLSFQVMNLGRSNAYNVRCEISGAGLIPSGTAFVGNMEQGTAANADVNVFIGTKDMTDDYSGTDKYGETTGTVTLLYEDMNGKGYSQEYTFTTVINEPIISADNNTEEQTEKTASQWWISVVVLGAIAAGLVAFFVIRKKRAKNEEI